MGRGEIGHFIDSPIAMGARIVTVALLCLALFGGPDRAARDRRQRRAKPTSPSHD